MFYSKSEEYLNSASHYAGALAGLIGLVFLIIKSVPLGNPGYITGSIIFSCALILLYAMSGTYHVLPKGRAKEIFQILDHSAIYILISASYTPYLLTVVQGPSRWILFAIQWSLTILGILFKSFFINRFEKFSTLLYLIMGWMVIFVFHDLKAGLTPISLNFLVAGGIFYSLGVIFYVKDKMKFAHFIWHLFVLAGSICNYFSVYYLLTTR